MAANNVRDVRGLATATGVSFSQPLKEALNQPTVKTAKLSSFSSM